MAVIHGCYSFRLAGDWLASGNGDTLQSEKALRFQALLSGVGTNWRSKRGRLRVVRAASLEDV
jgi:hypothetical protein